MGNTLLLSYRGKIVPHADEKVQGSGVSLPGIFLLLLRKSINHEIRIFESSLNSCANMRHAHQER